MSGKAAFAAIMLTGAGYLWWQRRQEIEQGQGQGGGIGSPAPLGSASDWLNQASYNGSAMDTYNAYLANTQSGGNDMKFGFNFAPLLGWGLEKLGGIFGGQSSAPGAPPSSGGTGGAIYDGWFGGSTNEPAQGSRGSSSGIVASLQTLIGQAEAPQGYNQVYGGSRLEPPRPITTMSVGEVLEWQDRSVGAGSASSAAGRYQVIRGTLRDQVANGTVSLNDTFDANTQDRIAESLMRKRGLDSYLNGSMSAEQFGQNLSKEWAGLPAITTDRRGRKANGQSYYAGDGLNASTVSRDRLMSAILGNSGGWV